MAVEGDDLGYEAYEQVDPLAVHESGYKNYINLILRPLRNNFQIGLEPGCVHSVWDGEAVIRVYLHPEAKVFFGHIANSNACV